MKVLILCNHLDIGGISRYVFLLAKGLVKKGHQVWVAAKGELANDFKAEKIEVVPLNLKIKSELNLRIFVCVYKLKKYFLKQRPDIIHANNRTTAIIAWWLSKYFDIPYVTTCHSLYKIRWSRRVFPFVGKNIIAISKQVEEQLVKGLRINPHKINLIYNGIDLDYFSPQAINADRKQFGLKKGDFVIGSISRLVPGKGIDLIISAFCQVNKIIPEAKLILVGRGPQETFLKETVEKLSLKDKIFFLGALQDTRPILKIMDIFCFLPSYEGFGLSLLEAMAMKVTVIASHVSEIPYLVDYGKAGVLIKPDTENLVSAIADLYQNPQKRKAFAEYGYQKAKEFSYLKMVEQTEALYNKVLKNART